MVLLWSILVGIAVLAVELLLHKFSIQVSLWLKLNTFPFMSKLLVAFLSGFIFFIVLTDQVELLTQKLVIIASSLLLIWANFYFREIE